MGADVGQSWARCGVAEHYPLGSDVAGWTACGAGHQRVDSLWDSLWRGGCDGKSVFGCVQ